MKNNRKEKLSVERLTYVFNGCWQIKGVGNIVCSEICAREEDGCENCPIAKAFDRLAAYEDTGLEPEEIDKFKKDIKKIKDDVDSLFEKQAFLNFLESKGIDTSIGVN